MATEVHAFVMAGGNGTRLRPLTDRMCKPALPFGADHRVIDFVLSNLRNSGVVRVDVLLQHKPMLLKAHLQRCWMADPSAGRGFDLRVALPPVRPQGRAGPAGYLGTADAVFQNLANLPVHDSDLVAVFSADHIYRMDVRQFVRHHVAQGADVSIAAIPVPLQEACHFGVVAADASGRAVAFHEKPGDPLPMPSRPSHALASMGNYLFRGAVLKHALQACCACGRFDFGNDVLPYLMHRAHVVAYDFESHAVPGLRAGEEPAYWRDVGTLDAYFRAQLDTFGPSPRIALDNVHWPLAPQRSGLSSAQVMRGESRDSRLGAGAVIDQACVDQTLVGNGVRVLADAQLSRCVLFDGVTVGPAARLRNVIVAEGNAVPHGERIGFDESEDRERFPVSAGGVVIVPPHHFGTDARAQHIADVLVHSSV